MPGLAHKRSQQSIPAAAARTQTRCADSSLLCVLPSQASASGGAGEVGNKAVKTAGVFLGAAALVALGSATGFVDPAIAIEGIEGEPNLLSDFYVRAQASCIDVHPLFG